MIDGSAAAPPLLLQLVLQQETKLTGIDVVVATKEALIEDEEEDNGAQGSMLACTYTRRRPISRTYTPRV